MSGLSDRPVAPYPPVQNGKEKRGGLILPADFARILTTAERAKLAGLATITSVAVPLTLVAGVLGSSLATAGASGDLSATDFQRIETPPVVSVYRTGALNIANNVLTSPVTWDTVAFDTHTMWAGGAPTRLTIPANWGGYWWFGGGCQLVANATGIREGYIRGNGANYLIKALAYANATQAALANPSGLIGPLVAGDYLELVPFQNSGGALATVPSQFTVYMTGFWVRP